MRRWAGQFAVSLLATALAGAAAADDFQGLTLRGSNGALAVTGGMVDLVANEYVWDGETKVSQLIWESRAFAIHMDLAQRMGRITFAGGITFAFAGNSYMEDYDWLEPYATGTGADDWSHRSIHDDTRLHRYIASFASVGVNVVQRQHVTAIIRTGLRYTDVQWTAHGGSFVYSVGGFRDTAGDFADGEEVITYRQQIPSAYAGLALGFRFGPVTIAGEVEAGYAILARATDDHWLRDLRFVDRLDPTPTIHAGFSGTYAVSNSLSIVVKAAYDRMLAARGDTTVTDTVTEAETTYEDGGGADLRALTATLGIRLTY